MNNTKKLLQILTAALVMLAFVATSWGANYNSRYGPVTFKDLPLKGTVSKTIWVGSWWPYKKNGIAWRHKGVDKKSPAELLDEWLGNKDKISLDKTKEYFDAVERDLSPKQEEIFDLIPKINRMVKKGEKWQESDDGKRYLELKKEIDEGKKKLPVVELTSATNWEIIKSGRGVIGVGSWWGHCNAWAATAIMDEEPRLPVTIKVNDVDLTFSPADIKALLTEAWMEHNSSFFGSRNGYDGDEDARNEIDFKDVTPAAFHIFTLDQIGNKDKSFVIDRYTGSQVWNQPMKAYWVHEVKKLYENDEAVEKDVMLTEYDRWSGDTSQRSLGKKMVFPVQITTTIHWVTDGLPPETLTNEYPEFTEAQFRRSSDVNHMTGDQIEMRTLTYTLYLSKKLEDDGAEILGDGEWNHKESFGDGYNHTHPDFMWQPLSNYATRRDYENPFVGKNYGKIVNELLKKSIEKPVDNTVKTTFEVKGEWPITDDAPDSPVVIDLPVDADVKIRSLAICIDVEHTYLADLEGTLIDPAGKKRVFKRYRWYGSRANLTNKCYTVQGFGNRDAKGTWKIEWRDNWAQDTGKATRVLLRVNDPADLDP